MNDQQFFIVFSFLNELVVVFNDSQLKTEFLICTLCKVTVSANLRSITKILRNLVAQFTLIHDKLFEISSSKKIITSILRTEN